MPMNATTRLARKLVAAASVAFLLHVGAGVAVAQTTSDIDASGLLDRLLKSQSQPQRQLKPAPDAGLREAAAGHPGQKGRGKQAEDPLAVAYQCLGALASHARKADAGSLNRARKAADSLMTHQASDGRGRTGWTYVNADTAATRKCNRTGSLDAFSDGTCNPPETPYMIQTGYAVACLAQAGIATGDARYVNAARQAVKDSWDLGAAPAGCRDCYYYWYSYHPNDADRYVRNTNMIMGLGVAWLHAATGDEAYRRRALAVARAENREIRAGNLGYFGIDDRKYVADPAAEADRIENHIPHQVKALKDIGTLLGSAQAQEDARVMLDAFLNCKTGYCRPDNCKVWAAPVSCKATATVAPCILADAGRSYGPRCRQVEDAIPRFNPFQVFLRHGPRDANGLK